MTDDVVDELRRYSYQGSGDEIAELVETMHRAADEIERLREQLRQQSREGHGDA